MDTLTRSLSIDRCLHRLGRCAGMQGCPEIFIEAEAALLVRRVGIWKVAKRIVDQAYTSWKIQRRLNESSSAS